MAKLAIVQKAPVFLDKEKTIARAVDLVKEAAGALKGSHIKGVHTLKGSTH